MALTTSVDQTVTLLAADGSRVDVVVKAGKHTLGKDPLQDQALEQLWGMFLATDPGRPQIVDEDPVPLPGVDAPAPAPAADTPTEG